MPKITEHGGATNARAERQGQGYAHTVEGPEVEPSAGTSSSESESSSDKTTETDKNDALTPSTARNTGGPSKKARTGNSTASSAGTSSGPADR